MILYDFYMISYGFIWFIIWGQLGPCWLDLGVQLAVKLRQIGPKLGELGAKMRFQRKFAGLI